ncbi:MULTISPECIES: amino acid-binding protein [unclassified Luteococcus]|uniref:amino acid-binding protein n=1 Tax=unclassified Luteococcus TaxID=2639923 RepID=UPI00313E7EF7
MVRVKFPDRPGSLGMVASAMGTSGADISAMEIVDKGPDWVIDDFMLTMGQAGLIETLIGTCNELDGVQVLWVSRYPDNWGIEGDIEALNHMTADPEHAAQTLTEHAPRVFHCQWAALVDRHDGHLLHGTDQSPDFAPGDHLAVGGLEEAAARELETGWLPGWGDSTVAVCPVDENRAIVLGRHGGPVFLPSELRRLVHLAALS